MQKGVIGLDFGTTNSGAAFIEFDEPVVIENSENERVTPSVVYFKEDGSVVVGNAAKRNIIANYERTVKSIKRYMGTDHRVAIGDESYPPEYNRGTYNAAARSGCREEDRAFIYRCGNYGACIFHGPTAPGSKGCRRDSRFECAGYFKRANCCGTGVWV